MRRRLNAESIFQALEPKLRVLIDNYESESIYALVISEGVVYIHTEAGFNKTLNEYIDWWDQANKPLESWEELEEYEEDKLDTWSDLDGIIDTQIQEKVKADESDLTRTHKVELLRLINAEREINRLEDTYRSEETRERVRKNIGDWSNRYAIALYGMSGYDEAAYDEHYELSDDDQKLSEYGVAMHTLLELIMSSDLFKRVNLSSDFYHCTQEHNY
ncbi:hypothetical protein CGH02_22150 [Vibrio parahaemolyticus]|uniref:hypothetical protein n=1 Tax=Vibrio parahaemolyticus TaxID=670 RepID=UPI00111D894E|nr:hypothetical protein [Vibrio parahaemolyticus]EGS6501031.1 hypothetical protein [Vibrio parahaemolyticus]ELF4880038.1 hypothetical protein [Vibrio parahaemolyticus]TOE05569.1 hypothetical protein CGJ50_22595 [Vibrio parahaemolyticus]TOI98404.1 hypothetical protein CGI48_22570 [Vibrio parahaemolyticus]TOJ34187.1 hypothetical protein CGI40_23010 [Vibrio parahaemolyticus]